MASELRWSLAEAMVVSAVTSGLREAERNAFLKGQLRQACWESWRCTAAIPGSCVSISRSAAGQKCLWGSSGLTDTLKRKVSGRVTGWGGKDAFRVPLSLSCSASLRCLPDSVTQTLHPKIFQPWSPHFSGQDSCMCPFTVLGKGVPRGAQVEGTHTYPSCPNL